MFGIKFAREGADARSPSQETALTRQAASEHVVRVHQYSSTGNIFYAICELCVARLSTRIKAAQGIEDDDEFWRLASQLTRGIADIHQAGILHLAIQVCDDVRGFRMPVHDRPLCAAAEYFSHPERRRAYRELLLCL